MILGIKTFWKTDDPPTTSLSLICCLSNRFYVFSPITKHAYAYQSYTSVCHSFYLYIRRQNKKNRQITKRQNHTSLRRKTLLPKTSMTPLQTSITLFSIWPPDQKRTELHWLETKCLLENSSLPIWQNRGMQQKNIFRVHRFCRMGWEPYASSGKKYERPEHRTNDTSPRYRNAFWQKNIIWRPVTQHPWFSPWYDQKNR